MKKLFLSIISVLLLVMAVSAKTVPDEGMWLPIFVKDLNIQQMQAMGLKLSAEDIYSINHASLKDAVVNFGNFCTAEVVSDNGLLFTNHHCGYDAIQKHSSVDHDYLTDGFWSNSYAEEIPCEGLTATFFVRMEEVSKQVLEKVNESMSEKTRLDTINSTIKQLEKKYSENGKYLAEIQGLFSGNEYYLFIYKVYKDVRLVATPPSSIGKFGGDTDNWMWPRHTGDFSIFRVYADKNNEPAEYSKDNVPFKPKYVLPISLKGYEKNDFTMIWGYPGSTDRYMPSYGVKETLEDINPYIDGIFDVVLTNMQKGMNRSQAVNIMYASAHAQYANLWKNKKGESRDLKRLDVYDQKLAIENEMKQWINANPARIKKYGDIFKLYENSYNVFHESNFYPVAWSSQGSIVGSKIIYVAFNTGNGLKSTLSNKDLTKNQRNAAIEQLKANIEATYKEYDQWTEELIFREVIRYVHSRFTDINALKAIDTKYHGDVDKFVDEVLESSVFASKDKLENFLNKPNAKKLENDLVLNIASDFYGKITEARAKIGEAGYDLHKADRLYVAALREMNNDKVYYPDANFTMRLTYGKVLDYYPADAVHYDFTTSLKGVMEKEDPSNSEFIVPEKLKTLYKNKDYGQYANKNGDLTVDFLTNNDITGGNSGSPVINGNGELIGLAFDGNWEAMSGDIAFEPDLQRCINVDIRYVLFVIDKYANCQRIINELHIVK